MNGYVFVTPCHGLTPCLLPPKQNALLFSEVACMQDELSARTEGKRLDTIPFAIGFLSVFAFIVSAIAFPEPFIRFMDLLQDKIVKELPCHVVHLRHRLFSYWEHTHRRKGRKTRLQLFPLVCHLAVFRHRHRHFVLGHRRTHLPPHAAAAESRHRAEIP